MTPILIYLFWELIGPLITRKSLIYKEDTIFKGGDVWFIAPLDPQEGDHYIEPVKG